MNILDHISESLETIFWVKILEFFDADPGFGNLFNPGSVMRNGKKSDPGTSRIRNNVILVSLLLRSYPTVFLHQLCGLYDPVSFTMELNGIYMIAMGQSDVAVKIVPFYIIYVGPNPDHNSVRIS
jgi:hypothetical protein